MKQKIIFSIEDMQITSTQLIGNKQIFALNELLLLDMDM
jgi:hypothetical protein